MSCGTSAPAGAGLVGVGLDLLLGGLLELVLALLGRLFGVLESLLDLGVPRCRRTCVFPSGLAGPPVVGCV
jgi:hypothetical protein